MTRLRRTTTTPVGHPVAGELIRDDMDNPVVTLNLGPDEELVIDDPAWSRDLMAAASVVTGVLESAYGMPAPAGPACSCDEDPLLCAHQRVRGRLEDERDQFRGLLARMVAARTMAELQEVLSEANTVLERYDRRDVAQVEAEAVSRP